MIVSLAAFVSSTVVQAQTSPPTPPQTAQSARQALLEMFLSKTDDSFTKHLTDDARQTLIRKGETPDTRRFFASPRSAAS